MRECKKMKREDEGTQTKKGVTEGRKERGGTKDARGRKEGR